MSDSEKYKTYKEAQSSISKLMDKGLSIDKNAYMNQLFLIKRDITANNENLRKAALDMLDFLLSLNIEEINSEVIKILLDSNVNKFVQNCILKSIKKKIKDIISKDRFDFIDVLLPWKNQNVNKLTNIIEDVCLNDLPKDKCKNFFIFKVVPTMMDTSTDIEIRNMLTDMAFMLSTIVPVSDLSAKELEAFLRDVNTKYVKNIGDLRDQNYPNWHNLWIFLVRFCDKNIHNSMELTNKLLRVVEYAFRNSSVEQRLKGYDCWKELIDNASLDMKHMCSPKQIKLLVTPLKAKFSKQEVVICKRFDVFVYLLEKLQHKAVLCLMEFLEFCFGPVGSSKDVTRVGQGKSVPQIWTKSTKALVDIIGHSHGKTVTCLTTEDIIKLEKPVINSTNLPTYFTVIINSVGECCSLLKEVDIESKRETVIKCMWKSVFNLVIPTTDEMRSKYFQVISEVIDNYIKECRENPYFEDLLILICTVLMSYDKDFVHEAILYILKQLLTVLFTTDNIPASITDSFKHVLSHAFSKILTVEKKLRVLKETMTCFLKVAANDENISHINKVWLCVANELALDLTAQQIEEFPEFNNFFMWPAFHLHHLEDPVKKQTALHWMKVYRKISLDAEDKKQNIMKDLQKIFKNNPLLSSNVVSLLNVMSQCETKFTKGFVIKLMDVSSLILLLPNLKTEDEQKITALVMQYFEPSLECYKCEDNEEVIKSICICMEHILCIHKGYKLLDALANFIRNSPRTLRLIFSHYLSDLFLDLYNKESDSKGYNAKELQKVLQVLSAQDDKPVTSPTFVIPSGRSARIANLAKNSPRSPTRKSKKVEPSPINLRLFGKDLDTMSPIRAKGSQLNKATPRKSRKTSTSPKSKRNNSEHSVSEENSSDFVPIDTEVKFQPEKLSRHQREVLRRRREDIPALYQDLSQSSSQDMFGSSSSSRDVDKDDKENSSDKRKVIVEVIEHHFKDAILQKEDQKVEDPFVITDVITEVPAQIGAEVIVSNTDTKSEDLFVTQKDVDPEGVSFTEKTNDQNLMEEKKLSDEPVKNLNAKKIEEGRDVLEVSKPEEIHTSKYFKHDSEDEKERSRKMGDTLEASKQEQMHDSKFVKPDCADEKETKTKLTETSAQEEMQDCKIFKSDSEGENERKRKADTLETFKQEDVHASKTFKSDSEDEKVRKNKTGDAFEVSKQEEVSDVKSSRSDGEYEKVKREVEGKESDQEEVLDSKSSKFDSEDEKKKKRKAKIEAELQKLKMDIVGADQFLAASSRRTRTREKPKKLKDSEIPKAFCNDEASTSQQPQHPRQSLSAERTENKGEKNRRKTIGSVKDLSQLKTPAVDEIKSKPDKTPADDEIKSKPDKTPAVGEIKSKRHAEDPNMPRKETHQDTPKTTKKRSLKGKAAHKKMDPKQLEQPEEESQLIAVTKPELKRKNKAEGKEDKEMNSKKGEKRKRSSGDEESEDIIESSQESYIRVTPIFNSSKRRSFSKTDVEDNLDKSEDKTIVQQKTVTTEDFMPSIENTVEVQDNSTLQDNNALVDEINTEETNIAEVEDISKLPDTSGIVDRMSVEEAKPEEEQSNAVPQDNSVVEVGLDAEKINAVAEDHIETELGATKAMETNEEVPVHIEEVGQEIEISDIVEETVGINLMEEKLDEVEVKQDVNTTQDTTITEPSTQDTADIQDILQNQSQEMGTQDTATQPAGTQDTQTQDTPSEFCASSEENRPPVLYFDLPKKPELTESERMMCRMDTMSICSDPNNLTMKNQIGDGQSTEVEVTVSTPEQLKEDKLAMEDILALSTPDTVSDIASSPITVETPNRTSEFLNNTVDISPINSKSSSDGEITEDVPISITRNFKAEMEELDRLEKEKKVESVADRTTKVCDTKNVESTNEPSDDMLNESDDLPSTTENIMNVPEEKISESGKIEGVMQVTEEVQHELDVPHHIEEIHGVSHQIEEISHHIEEVLHQIDQPRVEEVLHQIEQTQCHTAQISDKIDELTHQVEEAKDNLKEAECQTEKVIERTEDISKHSCIHERASKFLNMINVSSPATHRVFMRKRSTGLTMSPSTGRIKRLMSNVNQKESTEEAVAEVKAEDILTFSREVPSPLAVPRNSILKRKISDSSDTESYSPCPKRKRVNFSDPCLTSKKVFIKDDYREQSDLEIKGKEEHVDDVCPTPNTSNSSENFTETENVQTEPSLEMFNPLILRRDRPIYPNLVDCKEDVIIILKKVTSSMFVSTLMNKLKSRNIYTIGDLAKLSEAEVNRFPFKTPVVANVYKALDNYYKKNVDKCGKDSPEEERHMSDSSRHRPNNLEEEKRKEDKIKKISPVKTSPVKGDVRTKFKELLKKAKAEDATEDLAKMFLPSLKKQQLVTLAKVHCKMESKDFLEEKDFKLVIKHIIETTGVSGIFEMLIENIANSENESLFLDLMVKHSVDKGPLSNILEHRSLDDIKGALEESIDKNIFSKEEVLEVCLLPLIKSPIDISSYLTRISVVELGDILIKRLECTDLKQFFSRIIEVCGSENVVSSLNSELYKHFNSVSDIVESFKNCISVQDEERGDEVMVELFKFISSKLKLNTLLELHIDFLKRVPSIVQSSEKM